MQIIKRLAAMLSAILLISLLSVNVGASAADDKLRYGKTMLGKMGNSQALIYVYDVLVAECNDAKNSNISIENSQHKITPAELETVYQIFRNDYPEYFWLPVQCKYKHLDNVVTHIMPDYIIRKSISEDKKAVESKAKSYIQKVQGKLDFDKSHMLHDLLIENVTYDKNTTANNQDIYSAFVGGRAVCAGYAKAYEYLLHKVGIPAFSVTGQSYAPGSNTAEPHEWTMALLDGHWYCTDVTWDDQSGDLYHAYLNVTVQQLKDDHPVIRFEQYLPKTDSQEDNFFAKNKHKFSTLNMDLVLNDLKTQNGHSEIYYDGNLANMPSIIQSLASELSTKLTSVSRDYCTCDITFLGKEIHLQAKKHTVSGSKCSVCGSVISPGATVGKTTTKANGNSGSGNSGGQKTDSAKPTTTKANGNNSAKPDSTKNNIANIGNTTTVNSAAGTDSTDADSTVETQSAQAETVETQTDLVTDPSANEQAENADEKPNNTVTIIAIIGGAVVVAGAAAGTVFFLKKKKTQV